MLGPQDKDNTLQSEEKNLTTIKNISLKKLLISLSEKERQNLWITLGGQNPPHWRPLAYFISPSVGDKLDPDEIDTIELFHQTNPERAKALIIKISAWPEVTAELFVKGLRAIGLGILANEMGLKIGINPSLPTQSAAQNTQKNGSSNPITLKSFIDGLPTETSKDLRRTLGSGGAGISAYWWRFATKLSSSVTNGKLNLPTLFAIESENDNNPKRGVALILKLQEWDEVTPELFIKALYQSGLERLAIDLGKLIKIDASQPYTAPVRVNKAPSVTQQDSQGVSSAPTLKSFLNGLSYKDKEDLEYTLSTNYPAYWNDVAVELSGYVADNKLSTSTINHIKAYNTNEPQRVGAFLKLIQAWPEMTPQIFIKGLEKAGLTRLSNHLGRLIEMNPPQPQYSQPTYIPQPHYAAPEPEVRPLVRNEPAIPQNALDQSIREFLNGRLILRSKIVSELARSAYGTQDWRGVAAALQDMPQFRDRVTRQWVESIQINNNTDPKRSEAFLSGFSGFLHSSVRNFVKALAKFGHYQNLCKDILVEAKCPEYIDELIGFTGPQNQSAIKSGVSPTLGVGFYDKPRNKSLTLPSVHLVGKLDESIRVFFNTKLVLRGEVVNELAKDDGWQKVLTFLALQPGFQGRFQPNPIEWYEEISNNHGHDKIQTSEAILDSIGGMLNSTVAVLVIAIAASDSKYQHLCKKICDAAGAPNAINELKFDVDLNQSNGYRPN